MNRTILSIFSLVVFQLSSVCCFALGPAPNVSWTVQTADTFPPDITSAPDGSFYSATTTSGIGVGVLTHYSSTGSQLWRVNIGTGSTRAEAVRTDSTGNVYVSGQVYNNLHAPLVGNSDVFLRKYSSSGSLLWGKQFGTPDFDSPQGLGVSANGSALVLSGGWPTNYATPTPIPLNTIRQYSPDGTSSWVSSLNPGNSSYPDPGGTSKGMSIDSSGNIFGAFSNYSKTGNVISLSQFLSKTDQNGQVLWIKELLNTTNSLHTGIDAANNIYVTSNVLTKYDSDGNMLWTTGGSPQYFAQAVSPNGTVFVGSSWGDLVAFDPNGTKLWEKTIPTPAGSSFLRFQSMTIAGDQLIAGGLLVNGSNWAGNYFVAIPVPEPCAIIAMIGVPAILLFWRVHVRHYAK